MPAKGWIEVSDTYCKGCELCVDACPQDVLELDMERLTPKGYHPAHIYKDGCTGCVGMRTRALTRSWTSRR